MVADAIFVRRRAVFQVGTVERRLGNGSVECSGRIGCLRREIKAPFSILTGEHAASVRHRIMWTGQRHMIAAVHFLVVHIISVVVVALE